MHNGLLPFISLQLQIHLYTGIFVHLMVIHKISSYLLVSTI